MQFIANRRLENLNMNFRYDSDNNPFPWLSEVIDIRKQKNFLKLVIDYQDESALVDDFDHRYIYMYVDYDTELYEKSLYYRHVVDESKEIDTHKD